jgi:hypothetical protein
MPDGYFGPVSAGEALLFMGGLGSMMFLGVFGIPIILAVGGVLEDEEPDRFHSAPQVPGQHPSVPSPYLGTLAGMAPRYGCGGSVTQQSPFLNSSTGAWCCGMRAYEGFGQEARRSQRERLRAMADGELFDLMEEIVQESKRRRSA